MHFCFDPPAILFGLYGNIEEELRVDGTKASLSMLPTPMLSTPILWIVLRSVK